MEGQSSGKPRQQQGQHSVHRLKVSLEDLYNGTSRNLPVSRNIICPKCKGIGSKSGASGPCIGCQGSGIKVSIFKNVGPIRSVCPHCRGEMIDAEDTCDECEGYKVVRDEKVLHVHVKKGMHHGETIVFQGEAHEAPNSITGDIVVVLILEKHPKFKRSGDDLFLEHKLTLIEALCGFQFPLTQLDGRKLFLKSRSGEIIKHGM